MKTKIDWHGKEVSMETRRSVLKKVRQASILVLTYAVLNVPVDTGRLRNSIDMEIDELNFVGIIFTPVDYAKYVELGTEKQAAQPFMVPALFNNEQNIKRIFNDNKL